MPSSRFHRLKPCQKSAAPISHWTPRVSGKARTLTEISQKTCHCYLIPNMTACGIMGIGQSELISNMITMTVVKPLTT